ncbi:65-kDa microtubule-associated 3-like [Olea europaea subsp. europaea]|uniref:65-kDa microtubule-associated 3-like n=1 Tax=Olea europaea subsp. europaea TaxID=158383 RepID=A0A8S0TJA3_OLEEU|nr:65-kDa microtubule-associated 3-like [Olea europaea subsp. europaea]
MPNGQSPFLQMETACGSLLHELQTIWDEIGESDAVRDRVLIEVEQECLEIYRRKVDWANTCRAQLKQSIADAEAELAAICSAMGERPLHIRQNLGSLKAELDAILPQIEDLRKRKCDRKNQFTEILQQIQDHKSEIYGSAENTSTDTEVDETDLSLRKLEELLGELQSLHKEKSDRLKQVLDCMTSLNSLCSVLGLDFKQIVIEVHPSLGETEGSKDISSYTIEQLEVAIQRLRELKLQRMRQLQDLAASLLELWNLMETPIEEQQIFQKATCNLVASEDEITELDMLSVDYIDYVAAEVSRLEALKTSKMKEIVLKKKSELEDICLKTHLIPESDSARDTAIDAIDTGAVDAACLLEQIELQIAEVKEEAFSRKEILERVEKWIAACEEENWLEEYDRDENRYNAGRGTHLNLKRAEKARVLVSKLPAMVDALATKTIAWQNERRAVFTYDGTCLLSMLEEYTTLRQEKEVERKRQRDQKKLQGQLLAEQEVLYGSKPSPMKNQIAKKGPGLSCGGASNRSLSFNGAMAQTPKPDLLPSAKATPNTPRNRKKNEPVNPDHLRDEGRIGLETSSIPAKQHSLNIINTCETELLKIRKPFTSISSFTDTSKPNATNLEDQNEKNIETFHKTLPNINTPFTTPTKIISATEEENRNPRPRPSTPSSTVLVSMQTAMTLAPPASLPRTDKPIEDAEEIEYSFEERRAGFELSMENSLQVS